MTLNDVIGHLSTAVPVIGALIVGYTAGKVTDAEQGIMIAQMQTQLAAERTERMIAQEEIRSLLNTISQDIAVLKDRANLGD